MPRRGYIKEVKPKEETFTVRIDRLVSKQSPPYLQPRFSDLPYQGFHLIENTPTLTVTDRVLAGLCGDDAIHRYILNRISPKERK